MRVLCVGSNSGGGGTESHFISLTRALAGAGHEVIAAVRPDDFMHRGLAGEDRIRVVPVQFRSRRDLRAIRQLTRVAREHRPDWIIGWFKAEYMALAVVAKSAGVPLMLFSHLDQRIRPMLLHRLTGLVRGVIVPSAYLRARKIERGIPASKVVVLPNPIDLDTFQPDRALRARMRASLGLTEKDVLIGYAGRFEPEKGVPTLARALNEAMAQSTRVHALWVGHGKGEQQLRDLVRHGGYAARHHWMPWLDDVMPAYAAMDVLALPSEGSETFGRVLVEAQACGVAVLGAENGGIPEALADGDTGRVLPPGNVAAWTHAIGEMTADYRRARFTVNARAFAQRFDSRRIVTDFIRILQAYDPRRDGNTADRYLATALEDRIRLAEGVAGD